MLYRGQRYICTLSKLPSHLRSIPLGTNLGKMDVLSALSCYKNLVNVSKPLHYQSYIRKENCPHMKARSVAVPYRHRHNHYR